MCANISKPHGLCNTIIHVHTIYIPSHHTYSLTHHTPSYHTFSITLPHTLTHHTPSYPHTSHTTLPHSYPNGWHWCDCWSAYNPLHKVQRSSGVTDPCDHLPPSHPPNANVSGSLPYAGPSRGDSRISRWVSVCVWGGRW